MSFYIRTPKNTSRWYVWEKVYREGKPLRQRVPVNAYRELGFRTDMNATDAKSRASQLNKEKSLDKKKFAQAVRNEQQIQLVKSVYLPETLCQLFERHLTDTHLSSAQNLSKLHIHWTTVQKLIHKLELGPDHFWSNRKLINRYFLDEKISLSYAKKLIRMLNLWGQFASEYNGKDFKPVPSPKGAEAQRIVDENADSSGHRGASAPLFPSVLENMQEKLSKLPGQYEWMYISLWFGLRPIEVDQLRDQKKYRISRDAESGVDVLWVYQSKLATVSRQNRWKPIPVFLKEQRIALNFIKAGVFKRPLTKTIQKYSGMSDLGLYGGRKAFTDLMLSKGQKFEDVAVWLGHRSIDTTWRHYKQKNRITFTKVAVAS